MDKFETEIRTATERAAQRQARTPKAVNVRYDREQGRVVIDLSTGLAVAFPPNRAQGLAGARPADLSEIEITPSGYGLHFPKLDADLWLPALLEGVFGSRAWMAARLGAQGGKARSAAKANAARANGALGGRPRKVKVHIGVPGKRAMGGAARRGMVAKAKATAGKKIKAGQVRSFKKKVAARKRTHTGKTRA
jgi:hypothetical protein